MSQEELKQKVMNLLDEQKVGTLATVEQDKPHTRYMTFFHEGLTLYTPTSKETHKADEIEKNPNVHILIGYSGEGFGDTYAEIAGEATLTDDPELIDRLWSDEMEKWFKGKDDPNLVILKIDPTSIRYMNEGNRTPAELSL
ncbi:MULTISPECIES: pyridoxamine 5'-phosphate oxidase family protein [Bacillus]|uniref:pyridoxamine 5'-phosphate oxidase family protein n=1 Tax=Bacillus TaxID=1386 RepID=UPI000D7CB2BE|nr:MULTISPECIES: pyridoxamine 5'-phosphate oxidase family protein [Bacillus]MBY0186799.1 pyridoxamine 5'-phosphate oxidase family protein [Bacillus aerophilus]NQW98209.1 pyridoxamine 5'-phosphate oxidase family protein [Bacillus stratosphericus]MBV5112783.1 pyridoxamine 5'-phosphate oxidase family protein [Bacillus altitudinis]MBW2729257.1 pyridoxamine 5'-phosphate oxidase family protein [Bacillus altitudinis]MCA0164679.1 pyridoxamine 5'-phosphate oxidase family protein [Bacillus sp. RAR_M1_44